MRTLGEKEIGGDGTGPGFRKEGTRHFVQRATTHVQTDDDDDDDNHAMDITPVLNQVLATHNGQPVTPPVFRVEDLDGFLKEAYRIVGHVAQQRLHWQGRC